MEGESLLDHLIEERVVGARPPGEGKGLERIPWWPVGRTVPVKDLFHKPLRETT
jgi:hypothetical protein